MKGGQQDNNICIFWQINNFYSDTVTASKPNAFKNVDDDPNYKHLLQVESNWLMLLRQLRNRSMTDIVFTSWS